MPEVHLHRIIDGPKAGEEFHFPEIRDEIRFPEGPLNRLALAEDYEGPKMPVMVYRTFRRGKDGALLLRLERRGM